MKTRILSALVGLVILGVVLMNLDTMLLNLAISLICVLAVMELLNATGCSRFPGLVVLSMILTLLIPFVRASYVQPYLFELVYLLILAFFITMLRHNQKMGIEHFAMAFLFSTIVPVFFSCAVYLRDDYGVIHGGFYLFLALGAAWLADTGAYFTGRAFGKHKLAPNVSPKKTVEGAVGGLIFCTLLMLVCAAVFEVGLAYTGIVVEVHYAALAIVTPVFAVLGILGDLSASVIKRHFGVKDFGHIMPGHGGVLDRFDSVLFTLPAVYILSRHISLIS